MRMKVTYLYRQWLASVHNDVNFLFLLVKTKRTIKIILLFFLFLKKNNKMENVGNRLRIRAVASFTRHKKKEKNIRVESR